MKLPAINWMGWVLSMLVLLMFYFVMKILENPINLMVTGRKTTGVVVAFKKSDSLVSPVVRFTDILGKYVSVIGRTYSHTAGAAIGDQVTLFYDIKNPKDAQLLMWREFYVIAFLLGFIGFILILWICCFLIAPTSGFDDPLHILSSIIGYTHTSPWRLPVFFVLFCTISCTGIATYVTFKNALNLTKNGLKITGRVSGTQWSEKRIENGDVYEPAEFVMISYVVAGTTYTVPRALTKPLTRLKQGELVEIIYLKEKPNLGVVNTWDEIYFAPFIFALFFVAFTSLLVFLLTGTVKLPFTQP